MHYKMCSVGMLSLQDGVHDTHELDSLRREGHQLMFTVLALSRINGLEHAVNMARDENLILDRPTTTPATSIGAKAVKIHAVPE
jgi:hypothetical protein